MSHIYDEAKEKVIIEVKGGVVQNVYASNPEAVKVILIDYDNIDESYDPETESYDEGAGEFPVDEISFMDTRTRRLYREFVYGG